MKLSFLGKAVAAAVLAGGLAGCAPGPGSPVVLGTPDQPVRYLGDERLAAGLAAQEELLGERPLRRESYEQAAESLASCLDDFDVTTTIHGWDPVNQQQLVMSHENADMSEAELNGVTDACYVAHLEQVDVRYVAENPPVMAPDVASFSHSCLSDRGVPLLGNEESVDRLLEAASAVGAVGESAVQDCVTNAVHDLYPELPAFVFG